MLKKLDKLPQLPEKNDKMKGPAHDTNHIVTGRVYNGLCVGSYWGSAEDKKSSLKALIDDGGVTTFVCLIGEVETEGYRKHMYPKYT